MRVCEGEAGGRAHILVGAAGARVVSVCRRVVDVLVGGRRRGIASECRPRSSMSSAETIAVRSAADLLERQRATTASRSSRY